MPEFLQHIVVAITIIVIIVASQRWRKKEEREALNQDRMNFTVRPSKVYTVIGIGIAALDGFVLAQTGAQWRDDGSEPGLHLPSAILLAVFLFGIFLALYPFRRKIVVAGERLTLIPLFGKGRSFDISEVTHIKTNWNILRVYARAKMLFSAGSYSSGCGMLISYLIENGVNAPDKIDFWKPRM